MSSYWKANKATEKAIREAANDWLLRVVPEAERLTKEIGAVNFVISNGFFSSRVTGFEFTSEPDAKQFSVLRGMPDCWKPRARSKIRKRMDQLTSPYVGEIKKILGVGGQLETMGVELLASCVLITWAFKDPPVGCRRISDIQYQKLKAAEGRE